MNLQAILDATAAIAGGAAVAGRAGAYKGTGGITGVKIAFSLVPEIADLTEDGPAHVSWWDGVERTGGAGDLTVYTHTIKMQLCLSLGRSNLPKAISILTPFVPLYFAAFAAKVKLNSTCSVATLDRSPGIVESIYPDRLALEWSMTAVEKEAVTYVAA